MQKSMLQPPSTTRLILIPALISLAVTGLRLIGELQHWPEKWFSTATGGITPGSTNWIVGITWLALPHFDFHLADDDDCGRASNVRLARFV